MKDIYIYIYIHVKLNRNVSDSLLQYFTGMKIVGLNSLEIRPSKQIID